MKKKRQWSENLIVILGFSTLGITLVCLITLLAHIFIEGLGYVDLGFLSSFASRFPEKAGIYPALMGSLWILVLTAGISIPLGVATAIYLEEFAPGDSLTSFIKVNIANLAGVPSVVYGILGLAVFVRWLTLDRSLLSGAMTMSLLILPIIVVTTSEGLKSVSHALRMAAYGVGANRRQVVFFHVLPRALPSILTGSLLALSRAIGETAPLILVGALAYTTFLPEGPLDEFTVLPIQIFNWASRPQEEFHALSASGIIILLSLTLGLNGLAIGLRSIMANKMRSI